MAAARALKITSAENARATQIWHMFSTQLKPCTKEKKRCHLLDRNMDHLHVLVDPQMHIRQLMYVNISKQNMGRRLYYVASSTTECMYSVLGACALLGTGGSVGVWSVAQVVRKYSELASDSEVRSLHTELDTFLTLLAVKNESPNLCTCSQDLYAAWFLQCVSCFHMSRHSIIRVSIQHPLQWQKEASTACADWRQFRLTCRWRRLNIVICHVYIGLWLMILTFMK